MSDVLIWEQGGVMNMLFTKTILSITESDIGKRYCEILVDYSDEPIKTALTFSEIKEQLKLNTKV